MGTPNAAGCASVGAFVCSGNCIFPTCAQCSGAAVTPTTPGDTCQSSCLATPAPVDQVVTVSVQEIGVVARTLVYALFTDIPCSHAQLSAAVVASGVYNPPAQALFRTRFEANILAQLQAQGCRTTGLGSVQLVGQLNLSPGNGVKTAIQRLSPAVSAPFANFVAVTTRDGNNARIATSAGVNWCSSGSLSQQVPNPT